VFSPVSDFLGDIRLNAHKESWYFFEGSPRGEAVAFTRR